MPRISREQIAHDLTLLYLEHVVDFPPIEEQTMQSLEFTLQDMVFSYKTAYDYILNEIKAGEGQATRERRFTQKQEGPS